MNKKIIGELFLLITCFASNNLYAQQTTLDPNIGQRTLDYANNQINQNPNNDEAYIKRAMVYTSRGNYEQAIADFNKGIEINPNANPGGIPYIYLRGEAYEAKGSYNQAIDDYTKALEISPRWLYPLYKRATCYYYLRDYDKAWADVHQVEKLGQNIDSKFLNALKEVSGRDQ